MAGSVFAHTHRVTYAECTVGNHIYHARYLDLLEAARGEFVRHLGITFQQLQEGDLIFPVIEARLRYRAAARYDDVLRIEVWLTDLQRVRLTFAHRVLRGGQVIAEGTTTHACTSTAEKPKRMPENLVAKLRPYVHA